MQQLVVWVLDMQRYALPFSMIERVVRAVAVTPLPDAPDIVCGIVNVQGEVVPVVDMRRRLHLAVRDVALTDQLVLARTARRAVAFFADAVSAVAAYPDDSVVQAEIIMPGKGCIAGIARLPDGMILIHDLDRFLSLEEADVLDEALSNAT